MQPVRVEYVPKRRLCRVAYCLYAKLFLLVFLLAGCGDSTPDHVQLTEKLESSVNESVFIPEPSELGARLRINYTDLVSVIESAIPASQSDTGKKKVCKKVLGLKACSNVVWDYTLTRTGEISVSPEALDTGKVRIAFPFQFAGNVGVKGDLARVLGLSSLAFDGAMDVATVSRFDMSSDWCPSIDAEVDYQWTRKPRVELPGGLDFNLKKLVDKQLKKELAKLDERLVSAIDCDEIRAEIKEKWHPYSVPIELDADAVVINDEADDAPAQSASATATSGAGQAGQTNLINPLYFNVIPAGIFFSGVKTEADKLGLTLQMNASLEIDAEPVSEVRNVTDLANTNHESGSLPPLRKIPYRTGVTRFTLLIKAPYETLRKLGKRELAGREFKSETAAGDIVVTIQDIDIFPVGERLGIGLDFTAQLPASRKPVSGEIYLSALPAINSTGSVLEFTDFEVSKVIDSVLWDSLATIFKGRITKALEDNAKINLQEKFTELEIDLLAQLADTEKTRGAIVNAENLEIRLSALSPAADALVLRLLGKTDLDVELPFSVFQNL